MKFSIIIPSRNRPDALAKVLTSISQQHYKEPFEVIVVDQSDTPCHPTSPTKGRWIYLPSDSRGISYAKNIAIDNARGEYIIQLDDDSVVNENFLITLDKLSERYAHVDCLCGLIKNIENNQPFSRYTQDNCHHKVIGFYNFNCCLSAAMMIKRSILSDKIGLYDVRLGTGQYFGGSEETDLILRMLLHQCTVIYDSDFVTYHPSTNWNEMPLEHCRKKSYHYGCGRGAMWRKHLKDKPVWSITMWLISVKIPLIMSMVSLITMRNRQAIHYFFSAYGRIVGFFRFQ